MCFAIAKITNAAKTPLMMSEPESDLGRAPAVESGACGSLYDASGIAAAWAWSLLEKYVKEIDPASAPSVPPST